MEAGGKDDGEAGSHRAGPLRLSRRALGLVGLAAAALALPPVISWLSVRERPDEDLRRRVGQMLMVGFRGVSISDPGPATLRGQIASGQVGGVLYLGRNIVGQDEVRGMNLAFSAAGGALPPLIAVDQEGGRIERLTSAVGFSETPSARWFGEHSQPAAARERYALMARNLRELHFNTNLGPVVDLDLDSRSPAISQLERAYAREPERVAAFAEAFVQAHREASLLTALKHFPGHGSSPLDSHRGLPDITATWRPEELAPYRELFSSGLADMVMIGHLTLRREGEGEAMPATLSPALVTGLLRDDLGFDGVILSDDMEMRAITDNYGLEDAVIGAIRAGIDIVIVSNFARDDPSLPDKLVEAIGGEAMRDAGFRAMIDRSYARIVALKRKRLRPIGEGESAEIGAQNAGAR